MPTGKLLEKERNFSWQTRTWDKDLLFSKNTKLIVPMVETKAFPQIISRIEICLVLVGLT